MKYLINFVDYMCMLAKLIYSLIYYFTILTFFVEIFVKTSRQFHIAQISKKKNINFLIIAAFNN